MKIWYVIDKYSADEGTVDTNETFYKNEGTAQLALDKLESQRRKSWEENAKKNRERWEIEEEAIHALERVGIEWREAGSFRYHRKEFFQTAYDPMYVLRFLEVQ